MCAINHAPDGVYRPVYVVMQLGSLGGGLAAGALLARRDRFTGIATMVAVTAAWGGSKLVKRSTGRGRPEAHLDEIVVRGAPQRGLGFPSGHAGVATVVALMAAPVLPRAAGSRLRAPPSPRWSRASTSARTCRSTSPAAPRWASSSGALRAKWRAYARSDVDADPAAPRPERVEPRQPVHRLGRRRPHRAGRSRGASRAGRADGRGRPRSPTCCTRRCRSAPSAPPSSRCVSCDRQWIPVRRSWRLNERHYGGAPGAQQEGDRREVRRRPGEGLAPLVRRSRRRPTTDAAPSTRRRPALRRSAARRAARGGVPRRRRRAHAAVLVRRHRPRPRAPGEVVLVAAHGNSLRALVKHLDGMSDDDIVELNIPTGSPLVYELDGRAQPVEPRPLEDRYLGDPEVAKAKAEAVAKQAG